MHFPGLELSRFSIKHMSSLDITLKSNGRWYVLADETICVLLGLSLPGSIRMSKMNSNIQWLNNFLVTS